MFLVWLHVAVHLHVDMSKKVKRKATASGSCTTLSEKDSFFEIPQKTHQTLSI